MIKKDLKVNIDLGEYKAGSVVKINCHNDGIPESVFWRRRLKDANIDNCVEWKIDKIVKNKSKGGES